MNHEMSGILFRALCACLELTPASRDASAMIRRADPEPENPPRPGRNDNVIYYDLLPEILAEQYAFLMPFYEFFRSFRIDETENWSDR